MLGCLPVTAENRKSYRISGLKSGFSAIAQTGVGVGVDSLVGGGRGRGCRFSMSGAGVGVGAALFQSSGSGSGPRLKIRAGAPVRGPEIGAPDEL